MIKPSLFDKNFRKTPRSFCDFQAFEVDVPLEPETTSFVAFDPVLVERSAKSRKRLRKNPNPKKQ